jgi:hypothetical protein
MLSTAASSFVIRLYFPSIVVFLPLNLRAKYSPQYTLAYILVLGSIALKAYSFTHAAQRQFYSPSFSPPTAAVIGPRSELLADMVVGI